MVLLQEGGLLILEGDGDFFEYGCLGYYPAASIKGILHWVTEGAGFGFYWPNGSTQEADLSSTSRSHVVGSQCCQILRSGLPDVGGVIASCVEPGPGLKARLSQGAWRACCAKCPGRAGRSIRRKG